jgi:hypothetical protein
MLAWLAIGAAAAYDPDSLRSDASFGLFRDEYDFLREPATLSEQEGTHLFTVLGNQGAGSSASLGALWDGPVVLGALIETSGTSASASTSSETAPTALDPALLLETSSFAKTRDTAGFLGAGVPLGGGFAVGAGAELSTHRWDASLTPVPGGSPVVWGNLTQQYADGAQVRTETGTWTERSTLGRLMVGGAWLSESVDVEADVHVARWSSSASGEALQVTPTTEYSFAGTLEGTSPAANLAGMMPGGLLDTTVRVADGVFVRLFVEGNRGKLRPVVTERFEGFDDDTDPANPVTWERTSTLSDPDAVAREGEALLAVHLDGDVVDTRLGVGLLGDAEEIAVTTKSVTDDGASVVSRETRDTIRQRYAALSLPLAAEVAASERLTVRMGGRFVYARVGYEAAGELVGDPDEGDVIGSGRTSADAQSYVDLALGARWDASDRMSLDLVAVGTGSSAGRASVDLGQLLFSGVFHL